MTGSGRRPSPVGPVAREQICCGQDGLLPGPLSAQAGGMTDEQRHLALGKRTAEDLSDLRASYDASIAYLDAEL